jgi:hypothetical protein
VDCDGVPSDDALFVKPVREGYRFAMELRVGRRGIPASIDHGKLVRVVDAGELEPLEGVAAVGLRLGQGLWQASHPEIRKLTTERLALGFKSALEMSGNRLNVTLLQSILRKQGRAAVE